MTELREESVKHFAMPDGTYTAVTYSRPVHRKDANGEWQNIDNSLSAKAVAGKDCYATSDARVLFSKSYSEAESLFVLSENKYTVEMGLLSEELNGEISASTHAQPGFKAATVTNAEKRPENSHFDTFEEAVKIDNRTAIVYENVRKETDLEYILDGNDIKENIIVKVPAERYEYRFALALSGLTATLLSSGAVSLCDLETGTEQYTIPAPYMYDADGVCSYDVHYTLTPKGKDKYTLTVTASDEWINDQDRAFPITIDPTVTNTSQIFDTYIVSTSPNSNYHTETYLPVNNNSIAYFLFVIPDLPTEAILMDASLHIKPFNLESGNLTLGVYKMLEDWMPHTITWNSASAMTNFGMDDSPLRKVTLTEDQVYTSINITKFAQEWYTDRTTNLGVALKKLGGSSNNAWLYSCDVTGENQVYSSVTYRLFEDGIYFIQNVGTGKYMDVEGPSKNEGAIIQQWSFHGDDQSRWRLTHDSSGNIKIQSVYSNRYITTNSASSSITQTNTLNDYSTWMFQATDSGNYKIVCPTFPLRGNNTISAPSLTSGNGADLVMTKYTDDNDYSDEWRVYCLNAVVNLDVLYDQAYNYRYSSAAARIQSELLILQEKFLAEFGVLIKFSSPTLFSSYGDSACSSNPTTSCTHSVDSQCYNSVAYTNGTVSLKTYHHKNLYNMMLRIPFPDLTETLRVAFFGHDYCVTERNQNGEFIEHIQRPYLGLAYSTMGLASITNFREQQNEIKTLVHEFGHFYGAPDHYGGNGLTTAEMNAQVGGSLYSSDCLYGENRNSLEVLNELTICEGCRSTIKPNASRYDHE